MPKAAGEYLAYGRGMPWDALRQLGMREFAEKTAAALGNSGFSEDHKRWWADQMAASSADGLADHGLLLWDKSFDARPIMHDIRVPMLLLSPAHSTLVDLDDQKKLHDAVAGSKWEIVEGNSHEIYIEKAEECQRMYLDFVDNILK
jgi:pimeloyl-ACP methyl ester carboxylesterase